MIWSILDETSFSSGGANKQGMAPSSRARHTPHLHITTCTLHITHCTPNLHIAIHTKCSTALHFKLKWTFMVRAQTIQLHTTEKQQTALAIRLPGSSRRNSSICILSSNFPQSVKIWNIELKLMIQPWNWFGNQASQIFSSKEIYLMPPSLSPCTSLSRQTGHQKQS